MRHARAVTGAALAAMLAAGAPPARADNGLFDLGRKLLENADVVEKAIENRDVLLGDVGEAKEHEMGRAATAVLLGAVALVDDPAAQRYVNAVGAWLARHTERADLPWRFGILDSPAINAFAAPGGWILVTRGLFLALRDEHELAGVLAHEIGHVVARHHVEAMTSRARTDLASDVLQRATESSGVLFDAMLGVARDVYTSGLDQGDEHEADRMGVVIAARAGYDPWALAHLLSALRAAKGDPAAMGFFLSTHPPLEQRVERLHAALGPAGLDFGTRTGAVADLAAAQARLAR